MGVVLPALLLGDVIEPTWYVPAGPDRVHTITLSRQPALASAFYLVGLLAVAAPVCWRACQLALSAWWALAGA